MTEADFDINSLNATSGLLITAASLIFGMIGENLFPGRFAIVSLCSALVMLSIYTANPLMKRGAAKIFVILYVFIHLAVISIPGLKDSDFHPVLLMLFFIADYVIMVILLRKIVLYRK